MQKAEIAAGQLVKTRKDTAIMFDFVDKTLHQMTLTIKPLIVRSLSLFAFGSLVRWNDWFHFLRNNPVVEILSRIAPVSNDSVEGQSFHEKHCLTNVRFLSSRQVQPYRVAQSIDCDMNLGGEPTTTTAQRLRFLSTPFFVPQRRRDVPAQRCCQLARFPCRGRRQNGSTSVPRHLGHTNGQSVCKRCSTSHIRLVRAAIGNHYGSSRVRLRRSDGNLLHYRYKHSGLLSRMTGFLSIENHLIVQLT